MAAPSATHTRKRQFLPSNQTTLTSYFNRDANIFSQRSSPMSPELPPEIAAGLISVGMRVRKSVPEGYKKKAPDTTGFPFPSSAPAAPSATVHKFAQSSERRELTPFCGLHKTGGLAAQEIPSSSAPADMRWPYKDHHAEDMPELSRSQSSIASSQQSQAMPSQTQPGSKKRTYEEDAEAFMDDVFNEDILEPQKTEHSRPMARMKQLPAQKVVPNNDVWIFGSDDFEEASFLVPLEENMMEFE